MAMNIERKIAEADGLSFVGLHAEAWDVLEQLPEATRDRLDVVCIRIRICLGLEDWRCGAFWSSRIRRHDPLEYREIAGRFYYGKAVAWALEGKIQEALLPLGSLHVIWPEGRGLVGCCRLLEPVLRRSHLSWPGNSGKTAGSSLGCPVS